MPLLKLSLSGRRKILLHCLGNGNASPLPAALVANAAGYSPITVRLRTQLNVDVRSGFFEEQAAFFPPPDADSDVSISGNGETGWPDFAVC